MSEELLIRHCSPTLAGIKTGSIFTYHFCTRSELKESLTKLNKMLAKKGLRILPLRIKDNSALVYVYRPDRLKQDFTCEEIATILEPYGYVCGMPERCIVRLINRLRENEEFPHEIGLFLGYPPEDVRGFIENKAQCFKCVGCWKVYGDVKKANELFEEYRRCTHSYISQYRKGYTIEHLAVVV